MSDKKIVISIIIVNYNTYDKLKGCINSILQLEHEIPYEVIIIDNGSQDSRSAIEGLCDCKTNFKTIFLDETLSYSAANNIGIKESSGDYIIIMNPDIIFTEPLFVRLISVFERDSTIGGLCPALIGMDGNFQRNYFQRYPTIRQFIFFYSFLAKIFNKSQKLIHRYLENHDIDISTKKLFDIEQIPCAFFMTTKKILTNEGMMDEKFKLFFEDVDLSYRIRKKYKLIIDTSVKVTHFGGGSFRFDDNWKLYGLFVYSMIYFFIKHYGNSRAFMLKYIVFLNSLLILFAEYIRLYKRNVYRIKKHKYLLQLINKNT